MAEKKDKKFAGKSYSSGNIKVLEGLEGVRQKFDVIEISNKIKRQGDILTLSKELKIKPRILQSAIAEGRIKSILSNIQKSKAVILAALRTDREVRLFLGKYNLNNLPARELIKMIRKWNSEIQQNPKLLITEEEHDIILGSLLGDSSIRKREKNSCFRFSHSIRQKEYANWKLEKLNKFNISEFREVKRKIGHHQIHAIDFATKAHPIFNYYRCLFYQNKIKKVSPEILFQLNPRSLAIWICDDGSYDNSQGYIVLCTNSYTLEEHKLMKKFLNQKFSLDPTIGFRDKKYYYLRFKQDDTKKLINLIKEYIPECMKYKIGERNG